MVLLILDRTHVVILIPHCQISETNGDVSLFPSHEFLDSTTGMYNNIFINQTCLLDDIVEHFELAN